MESQEPVSNCHDHTLQAAKRRLIDEKAWTKTSDDNRDAGENAVTTGKGTWGGRNSSPHALQPTLKPPVPAVDPN